MLAGRMHRSRALSRLFLLNRSVDNALPIAPARASPDDR